MSDRRCSQVVHHHLGHGAPSFDRDMFKLIAHHAKSFGLNSKNLLILCSWMESKETSEKDKLKLIECLIPEQNGETIPEEVCIKLAYLLKSSKISLIVKVELLKWMICVHSFMQTSGKFQLLYEMFFGLLKKSKEMRPYVAHFICLITQKKHVTPRRVGCLFKLIQDECGDPSCFPIVRTYFSYAPEYFEDELHDGHLFQVETLGAYPSLIKNVHHKYEPNFSNVFLASIESNSTAVLSEYDAVNEKRSDTYSSRLTSFHQLYKEFRALERSNNVSKILESRLRRLFLTTNLKQKIEIKVHDYILSMFMHENFDSQDIIEKHSELFRLQHSIPDISEFTEFLLQKDNCNPAIVEVMCYEPASCFKKIEYKLRVIIGKILGTEDTEIKCRWLNALTKMFCYWTLHRQKFIPCDQSCFKCDDDDDDSTGFSATPMNHVFSVELQKFGSELDSLCDFLIMEDCSPFVLNQVFQHYRMLTIAHQKANFGLCFPSPSIFQLSLFSLTPLILETLCELLLRIKAINESKAESLSNEEFVVLQASSNDIKKVFLGGAYKNEVTYLAKTKTFKKLNERCSEYKEGFIVFKHPAFVLTAMEFDDINFLKSVIINPNSRQEFCSQLARNGSNFFIRFFSKIK